MPECTLRQPAGARAVAEGHEEKQDDHKTTKGTEQREERETEKRKQTNPEFPRETPPTPSVKSPPAAWSPGLPVVTGTSHP